MKITAFWKQFLKETNRPSDTTYIEAFYFGSHESSANELLALVLSGKKRATSSGIPFYEAEKAPLPKIGDLSVVTDWDGNPYCVIETESTRVLSFRDMTFDICKLEGEDDVLETWQQNHEYFFTHEAEKLGLTFTWDMPILFETFRVIYPSLKE